MAAEEERGVVRVKVKVRNFMKPPAIWIASWQDTFHCDVSWRQELDSAISCFAQIYIYYIYIYIFFFTIMICLSEAC